MNNLKDALGKWGAVTDESAHYDTIAALTEATTVTSPTIDKLSTWAAAGTAALAGLLIANIDKISVIYNVGQLKVILYILVLSLLFAILQKYFATMCSIKLAVGVEVKERMATVLENFDEHAQKIQSMAERNEIVIESKFDLLKSVDEWIKITPWYMRVFTARGAKKAKENRIYTYKRMLALYFWQTTFALFQLISLALFVFMATLYI